MFLKVRNAWTFNGCRHHQRPRQNLTEPRPDPQLRTQPRTVLLYHQNQNEPTSAWCTVAFVLAAVIGDRMGDRSDGPADWGRRLAGAPRL